MKLLYCEYCEDVFKLDYDLRNCSCGRVVGRVVGKYINKRVAVINGKGISIAIGNDSLLDAIRKLNRVIAGEVCNDRDWFNENCKIEHCWIRPNSDPGNPHTFIDEDLGNE